MTNEIVAKQDGALRVNGGRKLGLEEQSDRSDLMIPRAKLLQNNSPEVMDNPELRPGQIVNSVSAEVLPSEFVPIIKFTQWFKFNSREEKSPDFDNNYKPGAMIWRITDPHDPRTAEAKFGENGEKPKAMKVLSFLSYFPGISVPVVVSFANTSFKAGKKLNTLLEFAQGKAIFANKYKLKPSLVKGDKGPYWANDVAIAGPATAEEYAQCASWYEQFRAVGSDINVHVEEAETSEECPIQ